MFDHAMPLVSADDLEFADDGIGPSLSFGHLNTLALEHLGGSPGGNESPCSWGCLRPEPHPGHPGVAENQHDRIVHRGTKGSNPLSSSRASNATPPR
jgi:hypothetical protein